MSFIEPKWNPTTGELRRLAGLWLPGISGLVGGYFGYRAGSWSVALQIWGVALLVCTAGVISPGFMRVFYVSWLRIVYPVGWLVSHVALGVFYYLVFTPIGVAMRMGGYAPLKISPDPSKKTYWEPYRLDPNKSRYFKQF